MKLSLDHTNPRSAAPLVALTRTDMASALIKLFTEALAHHRAQETQGPHLLVLPRSTDVILVGPDHSSWIWLVPHPERTYIEDAPGINANDDDLSTGWVDSHALLMHLSTTVVSYRSVRRFLCGPQGIGLQPS